MSIIIFILVLALLIFVHEFGHFIAAKLTRMKVEEFSIGFKPAIFQKKKGETNYVLGLIPIGGYVKILGENPNEEEDKKLSKRDKKRTFSSRPKWAQLVVLSAGVIFNILLAWIFISTSLNLGFSTMNQNLPSEYLKKEGVKVLAVQEGYPADRAGIKAGDFILKIQDGDNFVFDKKAQDLRDFLKNHHENLKIIYQKDIKSKRIYRTEIKSLKEVDGKFLAGVYMADTSFVKMPLLESFYYGFFETGTQLKNIFNGLIDFFKDIFTAKADIDSVSGPVGIVKYIGDAAENGITALLMFTALLSLNLAVINFLPFPALDGGRAVFVLLEAITRKKIPNSIFNWVNGIGFIFLIGLMIVITFNDVLNLFK